MSTLDLRPGVVDVLGYAGDTLRLDVRLENTDLLTGRTFAAQVRTSHDATSVLATFTVTPTAVGAILVLPSDITSALGAAGVLVEIRRQGANTRTTVQRFAGVYDVQLADAATPPDTLTVVQGALTIDADVTRLP